MEAGLLAAVTLLSEWAKIQLTGVNVLSHSLSQQLSDSGLLQQIPHTCRMAELLLLAACTITAGSAATTAGAPAAAAANRCPSDDCITPLSLVATGVAHLSSLVVRLTSLVISLAQLPANAQVTACVISAAGLAAASLSHLSAVTHHSQQNLQQHQQHLEPCQQQQQQHQEGGSSSTKPTAEHEELHRHTKHLVTLLMWCASTADILMTPSMQATESRVSTFLLLHGYVA